MEPDFIDIHTHSERRNRISIVNYFPGGDFSGSMNKLFSVGLHPWFIETENYSSKLAIVSNLAVDDLCAAIGETGLDKLAKTDFELQKVVFESHIKIAQKVNKPIIIHCVRAFVDLIKIKRVTGSEVPWIVHGFNSKLSVAEMLISEGIKLSFGKSMLNENSNACKCLSIAPDDSFFLETDDSGLSIEEVYQHAACIKKISEASLKKMILRNFIKTFNRFHD
jgi:TatD DNase family protein